MRSAAARKLLVAAAFGVMLAAGCTKVRLATSPSLVAANTWTHHGLLRIGGISEPDTLNPVVGAQQIEVDLSMLWGGYLFLWDDQNRSVPELATVVPTTKNGGISRDGLAITYHLRRGVRWHDGAPFTAGDITFTWQQVVNMRNFVGTRDGFDDIARIDEPDKWTAVVHLRKPYAPFVQTFLTMSNSPYPVLPRHILQGLPDINRVPFNSKPIGTGPFKVVEWEHGSIIRFEANPDYWRGPPRLHAIEYHVIPDSNTLVTQLRTHDLDFVFAAPTAQYTIVKELPGYRVTLTPFTEYARLRFNVAKNPTLADVRVRRALAFATDRTRMIAIVTHGVMIPGETDQPPFSWAFDPNVTRYPYDPAKARNMLDEAGWHTGADGIRTKEGKRLEFVLVGSLGSATGYAVEALLQQTWRAVGVDVAIKNFATPIMFASYGANGILATGKYDVQFSDWVNGTDPDDSTTVACDIELAAGEHIYHYCSTELDRLEHEALSTYGFAGRKRAYDAIQSLMATEVPQIILWYVQRIGVLNTDFRNYKPAHAVTTLWNAWEWEI